MANTKVPYMPFYPTEYLADDRLESFSAEEHGAYLLLLMHMWRRGGQLPDDDRYLAGLAHVSLRRWTSLRPVLIGTTSASLKSLTIDQIVQPLISVPDDSTQERVITQPRLAAEYRKASALLEKQREGGRKGGSSPKGHPEGDLKDTLSPPQGDLKETRGELDLERDQEKDQDLKDLNQGRIAANAGDAPPPPQSSIKKPRPRSPEAKALAARLKSQLHQRGVKTFPPDWHLKAQASAETLLRSLSPPEAEALMDWALAHPFWAGKVTNVDKLVDIAPEWQLARTRSPTTPRKESQYADHGVHHPPGDPSDGPLNGLIRPAD